ACPEQSWSRSRPATTCTSRSRRSCPRRSRRSSSRSEPGSKPPLADRAMLAWRSPLPDRLGEESGWMSQLPGQSPFELHSQREEGRLTTRAADQLHSGWAPLSVDPDREGDGRQARHVDEARVRGETHLLG